MQTINLALVAALTNALNNNAQPLGIVDVRVSEVQRLRGYYHQSAPMHSVVYPMASSEVEDFHDKESKECVDLLHIPLTKSEEFCMLQLLRKEGRRTMFVERILDSVWGISAKGLFFDNLYEAVHNALYVYSTYDWVPSTELGSLMGRWFMSHYQYDLEELIEHHMLDGNGDQEIVNMWYFIRRYFG